MRTAAICTAAALSGAASLAYEIGWSRALVVPLGNSADAAALVLAGFMLGIALGARLGGGLAERVRSPLRLYAALEVLLGLYALVAPTLLGALVAVGGGSLGFAIRAAAGLALVATPGLAMGATLPLIVRALTGEGAPLRTRVGLAYGANTVGAALGALGAGFWGIAELGVRATSAGAAGASMAAAAIGFAASGGPAPARSFSSEEALPASPRHRKLALAGAFVAGFVMLALEVTWARMLTFVFGHDTYAFASLLVFVLLGLGLGGLLHRMLAARDPALVTAGLLAALSVAALGCFWIAAHLVIAGGRDPFGLEATGLAAGSLELEIRRELTYTPVLVLLPSLVAGALFPATCSLYAGGAIDTGRSVGVVGLVNGAGSALGAIAGAFGLVGLAGVQGSFVLLAAVAAATATATLSLGLRARVRHVAALAPLMALGGLLVAMPAGLPRQMLLSVVGPRHQKLLHYDESRSGTVSVIENELNGERQLLMNAVNEVTTRLVHDQSFKLLGHLGPLLHPEPRRAVMICLGAGIAAGAALRHPLERLDVVDLSSAVAGGARFFTPENNGVLDHPAFRLHIDDGRQFLLKSSERYDLAIIDSTHPKAVDSWILYTRELYDLVAERLLPEGIVVQWLPLHGLSEREFKVIVRTFQAAFPEMTLWANVGFETYGHVGYAKLVGTKQGRLQIDYPRLAARLAEPAIATDLEPYGMAEPAEILDAFIAGPEALARWTEGLPVQRDDHPMVPYTTSLSHGRRMEPRLLDALRESPLPYAQGVPEEAERAIESAFQAQGFVVAGMLDRARAIRPEGRKLALYRQQTETTHDYYRGLAARYPDDPDRLFEAATQLASHGAAEAARPFFEQGLKARPGDFRLTLNLALAEASLDNTERALDLLVALRQRAPRSSIVHLNLGALALAAHDPTSAVAHLRAAVAADPNAIGARLLLAEALLATGDDQRAEPLLAGVLASHPGVAEAHHLLAIALERRDDHARALGAREMALSLEPHRAAYARELALARLARNDDAGAMRALERALEIEPGDARTLVALGRVQAARGDFDRAAELQLEALDVDPDSADAAHHLGMALVGQGKGGEAVFAFCLALRLNPSAQPSRRELLALGRSEADCRDAVRD